jgi:glycosyltransferase involved in cell wall biosynthesis
LPARYALYLGGFDVRKNVVSVMAAFRAAGPELGDDVALAVAGRLPEKDTDFAPDPRRIAREHGLPMSRLKFLGWTEEADKPALYRGAIACLFPSRYEGFGLPPLESMACGTPVVGSNCASMPEIIGQGGLLFEPGDTHSMGRALARLARDRPFREEMGRLAVTQAARFSWESTARSTLAAYREAISIKA